jgi:fido (protein-threonine AMPylation protein)
LQLNMSIIEIELRSVVQLEHTHMQNIHRLCSFKDFSDEF